MSLGRTVIGLFIHRIGSMVGVIANWQNDTRRPSLVTSCMNWYLASYVRAKCVVQNCN